MKKKVLFMLINMNVGGTEKALLNMIQEMPKETYDITIFMLEKYGGFLNLIPSWVHVEYLKGYKSIKVFLNEPPHILAFNLCKEMKIVKATKLLLIHFISKAFQNRSIFLKYILKDYPQVDNKYDIAVAYAGPMDFISYFILHKIKANKKFQWIHFDVSKIGFNEKFARTNYKKFKKIFVVSNEAKKKLVLFLPNLEEKMEVFANTLSLELIRHQAKVGNGFEDQFDGLRILTVGRLAAEKGQDLAIRVLARLIASGYKVKWYCLGEGNFRKQLEDLVDEHKLTGKFVFLGVDPNPYPYIDQCNIYVQPSRHEGFCVTLAEARCLNKPIVTTNFTGAQEQISNEETGLIVGINEEEIYNGIVRLLKDKHFCERLSNNLERDNSNSTNKELNLCNVF